MLSVSDETFKTRSRRALADVRHRSRPQHSRARSRPSPMDVREQRVNTAPTIPGSVMRSARHLRQRKAVTGMGHPYSAISGRHLVIRRRSGKDASGDEAVRNIVEACPGGSAMLSAIDRQVAREALARRQVRVTSGHRRIRRRETSEVDLNVMPSLDIPLGQPGACGATRGRAAVGVGVGGRRCYEPSGLNTKQQRTGTASRCEVRPLERASGTSPSAQTMFVPLVRGLCDAAHHEHSAMFTDRSFAFARI